MQNYRVKATIIYIWWWKHAQFLYCIADGLEDITGTGIIYNIEETQYQNPN